jgi:hypothetical protein
MSIRIQHAVESDVGDPDYRERKNRCDGLAVETTHVSALTGSGYFSVN